MIGEKRFWLREHHIKLLRNANVSWNGGEEWMLDRG